jgi:hypothetical protein
MRGVRTRAFLPPLSKFLNREVMAGGLARGRGWLESSPTNHSIFTAEPGWESVGSQGGSRGTQQLGARRARLPGARATRLTPASISIRPRSHGNASPDRLARPEATGAATVFLAIHPVNFLFSRRTESHANPPLSAPPPLTPTQAVKVPCPHSPHILVSVTHMHVMIRFRRRSPSSSGRGAGSAHTAPHRRAASSDRP